MDPMPVKNESRLREQLMAVPDAFERMNYLVGKAGRQAAFGEELRIPDHLVAGCVSEVWLVAERDGGEGNWGFSCDSDAPMVRAVASLLCEIFSGATSEEVRTHEPTLLADSGVLACLTQSRRAGARRILARIKAGVR